MKTNCLIIEMADGEWAVPVAIIAKNRAEYFAHEFENDVEKSLADDTLPLFKNCPGEIYDWAENNLDWDDVRPHARKLSGKAVDYDDGWANGDKRVEEIELPK